MPSTSTMARLVARNRNMRFIENSRLLTRSRWVDIISVSTDCVSFDRDGCMQQTLCPTSRGVTLEVFPVAGFTLLRMIKPYLLVVATNTGARACGPRCTEPARGDRRGARVPANAAPGSPAEPPRDHHRRFQQRWLQRRHVQRLELTSPIRCQNLSTTLAASRPGSTAASRMIATTGVAKPTTVSRDANRPTPNCANACSSTGRERER